MRRGVNKAAFVRQFPESVPTSEVVRRAAVEGLYLPKRYVREVRALHRRQRASIVEIVRSAFHRHMGGPRRR